MDIDGQHRKGDKDRADWNMDDEGITKQLLSYDIYLKGNVSKATSFFKTVDGQAPRFRMFPYVEKKRRVDDYGETIDVGMWLRKSKILEEEAESDDIKDYRRRQAEEELKRQALEPPSKFVSSEVEVQMACRLLFVDMEGLSDGRAIKTIIPQIGPRKMIVVHASESSTNALIESCANIRAMTKEIYAPTLGESIQIGQQISNFYISISDELLQNLNVSRFEDNEVGFVTGRVVAHASSIVPILEPVSVLPGRESADEVEQAQPKPLVLGSRPAATLPSSTMIGELKLTALKSRLTAIGIHAELAGEGVLICGATTGPDSTLENTVAVRKTGIGPLVELEGNVSDVYYAVRQEIYNLHALVGA
ncbi:hypothetical protein MPER_06944 [Moniliophthora perniciosa FA553]|nr:hypothetical protein MPER_06944 [Moniliophthora perniciosa FA553]